MESTKKKFFLTRWGSNILERCRWSNCGMVGKTIWVLLAILFPLTLFIFRGLYQPVILFIVLRTPLALLVLLTLLLIVRKIGNAEGWWRKTKAGFKWSFISALIYLCGAWSYEYVSLAYNYSYRVDRRELTYMPVTANEKVQAVNSIHSIADHESVDDTKDVDQPHFVRFNDEARKRYGLGQDSEYWFTMAVEPSKTKIWQYLFGHIEELFFTPGNTLSPKFDKKHNEVAQVEFAFGENLKLSSNVKTAAIKKLGFWQYFRYEPVSYSIYIPDDDGEFVQIVPLIKWTGWLCPMPEYGGVVIFKQGHVPYFEKVLFGGGTVVTKDRIKDYPYLKGQLLVPEEAAIYIAKTFRFHESLWAPLPGNHEGDIRIPNAPNEYTRLPFEEYFKLREVSDSTAKDGLCHYIPLEPYGEDKRLLSLSLFVKGDDASVYYFDHKSTGEKLMGPTAIPSKVRDYMPSYDWDRAMPTEITPVVRDVNGDRHFFWKSNIQTTSDDSTRQVTFGKAEITLIDAADRQVCIHLEGTDAYPSEWQRFMDSTSTKMPRHPMEDVLLKQ